VPVDFSGEPAHQVRVARGVADRLTSALLITHVVEPTRLPFPRRADGPRLDAERRAQAQESLGALVADNAPGDRAETLVAYGDPAEEIVRIAKDRHAGLIVMPLSIERAQGPLVGSVTYRVLCLASSLVLALPAVVASKERVGEHPATTARPY